MTKSESEINFVKNGAGDVVDTDFTRHFKLILKKTNNFNFTPPVLTSTQSRCTCLLLLSITDSSNDCLTRYLCVKSIPQMNNRISVERFDFNRGCSDQKWKMERDSRNNGGNFVRWITFFCWLVHMTDIFPPRGFSLHPNNHCDIPGKITEIEYRGKYSYNYASFLGFSYMA